MRVRVLAAVVVLACLASSAFAFIGPSTAGLSQGQWSAGANYDYSSQDLDKETIKYTYIENYYEPDGTPDGDPYTESGSYKLEVRNFNLSRYYGKLGYGITDQLEVYGQLGIADLKAEARECYDGDEDEWYGSNFDNALAWGLGTKYTFYKQDKIDWGVGLQLNMYSTSVDYKGSYADEDEYGAYEGSWKETTDIDTLGLILTVGPTVDMDGWKLYGGVLVSYLSADYDYKYTDNWLYEDDYYGNATCKDSGSYDQTSFGGYVGAQCKIYENWDLAVEFQATNDGWGAGVGVEVPF